jgi:hypothetical protein
MLLVDFVECGMCTIHCMQRVLMRIARYHNTLLSDENDTHAADPADCADGMWLQSPVLHHVYQCASETCSIGQLHYTHSAQQYRRLASTLTMHTLALPVFAQAAWCY